MPGFQRQVQWFLQLLFLIFLYYHLQWYEALRPGLWAPVLFPGSQWVIPHLYSLI